MCNCDIKKTSIKFTLVFFCASLQLGSCGLKLFRQLGHTRMFFGDTITVPINTNQSPCPNIFEYRFDELGTLYGFIEVAVPDNRFMELDVQFCVGNRVNKGAEGSITIPFLNNQQIINNIQQMRNLDYRVNFPEWKGFPPRITKITVNGNIICTGQPYSAASVPVLTTINLRHKLQVNTIPLYSSNTVPVNGPTIQFPTVENSNSFLDTRRDNFNNSGNPYNFKPDYPRQAPKINFKPEIDSNTETPYARNPFLNNRLSTNLPNAAFGSGGPFIADVSTTERIVPDLSLQNIVTRSPALSSQENLPEKRDSTSQNLYDVCGRPVVTNSLILQGHEVPRGAFPWLVAMFMITHSGLEYKCTSTLISSRYVVTAAHCVKRESYLVDAEKIVLVMGRLSILDWGSKEGERIIGAEEIFVHPNYTPKTADADISVIRTKGEIEFSVFIRPICLWLDNVNLNDVVGKKGTVVGWGMDENGHKVSPEPKQLDLPIVSQEQCLRSNYSFSAITSEHTFCAGDRKGSGPCNGDSGGGFVMMRNGRWHLRGIVSMSLSAPGTRTCDLSNYVVFTDASKYGRWLRNFIE